MLEYPIRVKGYAAERDNFREEVVITKVYGTETETVKSTEYEPEDETKIQQKVDTSKKKKAVTAFPESEEEIVALLDEEVPYRIIGMFKEVAPMIRGDTKQWKPPKGRYGISNQLQNWIVKLDNIEIENVKRSQFLQLHSNFNAQGSTLEYGDSVDFTADMQVWTPALDYDGAAPIVERIIELSRLKKFGPFRHAKLLILDG